MDLKQQISDFKKLTEGSGVGNVDALTKSVAQLVASFAALSQISKSISKSDVEKLKNYYKELTNLVSNYNKEVAKASGSISGKGFSKIADKTGSKNSQIADEGKLTKIQKENLKVLNKIELLEERMKSHQGGKIRAVKTQLAKIKEMHHYLEANEMSEKDRLMYLNKINIEMQKTRTIANKGTIASDFMANLSPQKLISRASFVVTARAAYTTMDKVNQVIRDVINLNVELEEQLSKTFGIAINKSNEFKDAMMEGVLNVMRDFNMTLEESTKALYNIVSAQIDENKALNVLSESAKLAKANFSDLGDTTKLVSGILNAYNMDADETSRISDILSESVRLGVFEMSEYTKSLDMIIPTAQASGVSLEELIAVITTMTKNGIHANKAITSLRQVFQMLTNPTKKQIDLLRDYDISLRATDLRSNGLIKTLDKLSGLMMDDSFGLTTSRRGQVAYMSFMSNIQDNYTNLDKIMNANGATSKILSERVSTLSSSWDTLNQTITNFIAVNSVTDGFFGNINKWVTSLNSLIRRGMIPSIDEFNSKINNKVFGQQYMRIKNVAVEISKMSLNGDELVSSNKDLVSSVNTLNEAFSEFGIGIDVANTKQSDLNDVIKESFELYELLTNRQALYSEKIGLKSQFEMSQARYEGASRRAGVYQAKEKTKRIGEDIMSGEGAFGNVSVYEPPENLIELINAATDSAEKTEGFVKNTVRTVAGMTPLGLLFPDIENIAIGEQIDNYVESIIKQFRKSQIAENEIFSVMNPSQKYIKSIIENDETKKILADYIKNRLISTTETDEMFDASLEMERLGELLIKINNEEEEINKKLEEFDKQRKLEAEKVSKLSENAKKLSDDWYILRQSIENINDGKAGKEKDSEKKRMARDEIYSKIEQIEGMIKQAQALSGLEDVIANMKVKINVLRGMLKNYIYEFEDFDIGLDIALTNIFDKGVSKAKSTMSKREVKSLGELIVDNIIKDAQDAGEELNQMDIDKITDDVYKAIRNNMKRFDSKKEWAKIGVTQDNNKKAWDEFNESLKQIEITTFSVGNSMFNFLLPRVDGLYNSFKKLGTAIKGSFGGAAKNSFLNKLGFDTARFNLNKEIAKGKEGDDVSKWGNYTEKDEIENTKAMNDMIADVTISSAQQLYGTLTEMYQQQLQKELEMKLESLENKRLAEVESVNQEIMTAEHRANELNAINNKYEKKKEAMEKKAAKKQAKINKKMAIVDATMDFANASMGIWSFWSDKQPIMIPIMQAVLAGVYGANLALINKTKYAKGGILQGESHANGGIPLFGNNGSYYGEAEGGEAIFSKRATQGNEHILMAQNRYLSKGGSFESFVDTYMKGNMNNFRMNGVPKGRYASGGVTQNMGSIQNLLDKLDNMAIISTEGINERDIYRMSRRGKMMDRSI